MRAKIRKGNWPLRLAVLLITLILLTGTMLVGFYARFRTTGTAEDSARVAAFSIEEDLATNIQSIGVDMAPGDGPKECAIDIANKSEVAVQYTVEFIRETENLPLTLSEKVTGTLAPGENGSAKLTVSWDENKKDSEYSNEIDLITVKLTAEQID